MKIPIWILFVAATLSRAADIQGAWIAEISSKGGEPQYARVQLRVEGSSISGQWNQLTVTGSANGGRLNLSLLRNGAPAGSLAVAGSGDGFSGEGRMTGGRGAGGGAAEISVTVKLTRPAPTPVGGPRTLDFEPRVFYGYYSASNPPALRIFPGDTVRTRTYDASGRDNDRRTPGGNLETGPFYIEGALPGDTLVVELNRVRVNRDSARQGSRINGRTVTPAYAATAQYDAGFRWRMEARSRKRRRHARASHATDEKPRRSDSPHAGMHRHRARRRSSVSRHGSGTVRRQHGLQPDGRGSDAVSPGFSSGRAVDDGRCPRGDGRRRTDRQRAETSVDVTFTVDLIPGFASAGPRLENADSLMAMGVAGSVADSIQIATTQLVEWLKRDYKLNDSEVAVLLGAVIKYDITEMVDPQFNVVARVPKSAVNMLR